LLGLLSEQQGLYSQAMMAFDQALGSLIKPENQQKSDYSKNLNCIISNIARVLLAQGFHEQAIQYYLKIQDQTLDGILGLGISYFFNGKLEDSMKQFELSLKFTENDQSLKAQVLFLICKVLFALGTPQHRSLAKQELGKLSLIQEVRIEALTLLMCIGILENDLSVISKSTKELQLELNKIQMSKNAEFEQNYLKFILLQSLSPNDPSSQPQLISKDIQSLSSFLHSLPKNAAGWARLSAAIIASMNKGSTNSTPTLSTALSLSTSATTIAKLSSFTHHTSSISILTNSFSTSHSTSSSFLSSIGHLHSISLLIFGKDISLQSVSTPLNIQQSLTQIQKSVHLTPSNSLLWSTLASTLLSYLIFIYEQKT